MDFGSRFTLETVENPLGKKSSRWETDTCNKSLLLEVLHTNQTISLCDYVVMYAICYSVMEAVYT